MKRMILKMMLIIKSMFKIKHHQAKTRTVVAADHQLALMEISGVEEEIIEDSHRKTSI